MAATFRPVNTHLAPATAYESRMTTSPATGQTPRPSTAPHPQHQHPVAHDTIPEDATTPTRASFGRALASQKPLPSSPFPEAVQVPDSAHLSRTPARDGSRHSRKSRDSEDVDMDDSDGDTADRDDGALSDDDSANGDDRSGKKKKSQRFYCTDYPPCNLSFTRSEHLARHIRKHTGERPFQCHCSRRFSRLDNLRQHAQTVHVNEDIPIDSLAATGARFQRQIRTDRVRPSGGRSRASTAGSTGGPVRGHSKSLSTSSIGSVASIGSAYGPREDLRRRPPPLVMAEPRPRGSLEGYRTADGGYVYRPPSPGDFSTPTSATFSTGQSSPRWGSAIVSPTTSHSRSQSMYSAAGARTPGRRLSVPSGANPFQSPHGSAGGISRPVFGPAGMNSSNSGAFSPATSSIIGSPTTPSSAWSSRRDSTSSAADEAWRRRTWHPESRAFNPSTGSQLSNVMSSSQFQPGPPLPIANAPNPQHPQQQQQQQPIVRLPGIESFDPLPPRNTSPPRRNASPMMVDQDPATANNPPPALLQPGAEATADDRRNVSQWDMGLHRGLTRLDIRSNVTPPRDSAGAWANEVNQAVQAQAEQVRVNPPTVRFELGPPPTHSNPSSYARGHQHTMSAPSFAAGPREPSKRHGWYHGPAAGQAPQPQAEAGGPHVDRLEHPNMTAFRGFPARDAPREAPSQPTQGQPQPGGEGQPEAGSSRFDALVAVAASEGSTAKAY